jgi:hypothetical protein
MSDKEQKDRVRISQVLAGALAAVTAALLGSTMGVAGTVVGAGLASVVSTVGGALYLRSIERTRDSVLTVRAKVVGRSGGTTVLVADGDTQARPDAGTDAATGAVTSAETGDEVEAVAVEERDDHPPAGRRRLSVPMLVLASLAVFALGMLAVTGVEWLRGESLSGTGGTTFGSIVDSHRDGGTQREQPADPTTSTTAPTAPSAPSTGSRESASTTTEPTGTTTTPPSSDPATTTTTTAPPVTTTTEAQPPGSSVTPFR